MRLNLDRNNLKTCALTQGFISYRKHSNQVKNEGVDVLQRCSDRQTDVRNDTLKNSGFFYNFWFILTLIMPHEPWRVHTYTKSWNRLRNEKVMGRTDIRTFANSNIDIWCMLSHPAKVLLKEILFHFLSAYCVKLHIKSKDNFTNTSNLSVWKTLMKELKDMLTG